MPIHYSAQKGFIDRLEPKGSHMSEPILSPDGKMMWDGSDWIQIPVQSTTNIQDSVVMGDINTKIEHSVHNTYSQDTEKMVRNHLHITADKMASSQFDEADAMFEKAKQIDYHLANKLYNEEFAPIFVDSLWSELSALNVWNHSNLDIKLVVDRINRIHKIDMNHLPSLLMSAELLRLRPNNSMNRYTRLKEARKIYNRILSLDPENIDAKKGITAINSSKRAEGVFYLFAVALVFFFAFTR